MARINIICTLLFICFNVTNAQWTNNQNASQVIGQPDFTTYNNTTLNGANEIVLDITMGKAYIVDCLHYRVLRFAYPFSDSLIIAEMQFGTGAYVYGQNSFTEVLGAAVYNDVLYILDNGNRILRFDNASTKTDRPNADGIIGQTSYSSYTSGISDTKFDMPQFIYIDGNGNLWVPDQANNRVLRFSDVNSKPTDGTAAADLVLGQMDFTTKATGTSSSSMKSPNGVCVRGTTVWVSDTWNYRVLRFDNPSTNGVTANGVLGVTSQAGPTQNKLEMPTDLEIDGNGNLYVADMNRVLIFLNAAAKADGANADNILGQSSWTSDVAGGDANGLNVNWTEGLAIDNANQKLFVADFNNNRVLGFTASSALPVELSSFTASMTGTSVKLIWTTATEINNYGFIVERRAKSSEWKEISFIQGNGNSNSPKSFTFVDFSPLSGKVQYRLKQLDIDGKYEYSSVVEVKVETPTQFKLAQNFPNPFNPETIIRYELKETGNVSLKIYDQLGKEVAELINEEKSAGTYEEKFDGSRLASGIYFYQLKAGDFIATRKIILMK